MGIGDIRAIIIRILLRLTLIPLGVLQSVRMMVGKTMPRLPRHTRLLIGLIPLRPPNPDNLNHGRLRLTTHITIHSRPILLQHLRRMDIIQHRLRLHHPTLPPRVLSPMPSASSLILVYLDLRLRYLLPWLLRLSRLRHPLRFFLLSNRNGRS